MLTQFSICSYGRKPRRWIVRRDDAIYGEYLDKEQAKLDAVAVAKEVVESGEEAEVWDDTTRVF